MLVRTRGLEMNGRPSLAPRQLDRGGPAMNENPISELPVGGRPLDGGEPGVYERPSLAPRLQGTPMTEEGSRTTGSTTPVPRSEALLTGIESTIMPTGKRKGPSRPDGQGRSGKDRRIVMM